MFFPRSDGITRRENPDSVMYPDDEDLPRNSAPASKCLRAAADQGNPDAQDILNEMVQGPGRGKLWSEPQVHHQPRRMVMASDAWAGDRQVEPEIRQGSISESWARLGDRSFEVRSRRPFPVENNEVNSPWTTAEILEKYLGGGSGSP